MSDVAGLACLTESMYAHLRGQLAGSGLTMAFVARLSNVPHIFCEAVKRLLATLAETFEERADVKAYLTRFEAEVLGNREEERRAVDEWHLCMTTDADTEQLLPDGKTLYDATYDRRMEEVVNGGVSILADVNFAEMFFDADLGDEDREMLCQHIDKLNNLALVRSLIPPDMADRVDEVMATAEPGQEVTPDTITALFQRLIGADAHDAGSATDVPSRLMGWASQLATGVKPMHLRALQTTLHSDAVASVLAGSPLSVGALDALMARAAREVRAGGELVATDTDGIERGEESSMTSILESLQLMAASAGLGGGAGGFGGFGGGTGALVDGADDDAESDLES